MTDKVLLASKESLDDNFLVIPIQQWDSEIKFDYGTLDDKSGVLLAVRNENGTIQRHYKSKDEFLSLGVRTESIQMKDNVREILSQ